MGAHLEDLVTQRQEQLRVTTLLLKAGRILPDVLSEVDPLLTEAKGRLEQARAK